MKHKLLSISLALSFCCGAFTIAELTKIEVKEAPVAVEAASYDTFYKDVNGSGSALLTSIRDTLVKTHKQLTYANIWTAFRVTDLVGSNKIRDLYSNNTNFTVGTGQCGSSGSASAIDICYNREHTIPRSWWGGGYDYQGSDIYIVLPSDSYINENRSNYPYGETGGSGTRYALDGDPAGNRLGNSSNTQYATGTVFEPFDDRKGDLARIIFYSVARWEDAPNWNQSRGKQVFSPYGNNGITYSYLKMLLKWHTADPVDDFELNRNDGGQLRQGNRNPFVDHPSWVDLIWGGTYKGNKAEDTTSGIVVNGKMGEAEEITLSRIEITGQTTEYMVGDEFTYDGKCTAYFSDGSSRTVTPKIKNTPNMSAPGEKSVTFTFTYDGVTKEFVITITVKAPDPLLTRITLEDIVSEYEVGDEFVKPTVMAIYDDGTSENVTEAASFSGFDMSVAGTYTVTVSYEELETSFTITVEEKGVDPDPPGPVEPEKTPLSLAISNLKTYYVLGEKFEKPTVIVTYVDQTTKDVTDKAEFTGFNIERLGSYNVIVSYSENGTTITVGYAMSVNASPQKPDDPAPASSGCSGSITSISVVLSILSLIGVFLILIKRRKLS